MFGVCIKNFFHNLRYVFTVLGCMFLAAILAASALFGGVSGALKSMVADTKQLTRDTDLSVSVVAEGIREGWSELALGDLEGSIEKLSSEEWFQQVLFDPIEQVVENYTNYLSGLTDIVVQTAGAIFRAVLIFLLWMVIGPAAGYILVMIFSRSDIERRNIFKVLLAALLDTLIVLSFTVLCVWLFAKIQLGMLPAALIFMILYGFITLLGSWLGSGCKKRGVRFGEVVNVRPVLVLFLGNVCCLLLSLLVGAAVWLLTGNLLIGFTVNESLAVITISSVSLNADAIVNRAIRRKAELPPAEPNETAPAEHPIPQPWDAQNAAEKEEEINAEDGVV